MDPFVYSTAGKVELAVLVLPLVNCSDCLHHIPVFGNISVLNAEQVIEGSGLACKCTFTYCQHEVTMAKHCVNLKVFHLDSLFCHGSKCCAETVKTIGDGGVVLDILVAVEIFGQLIGVLSHEHVLHKATHNSFILSCLVNVGELGRAVKGGATAGIGFAVIGA